jgi:hypothetical protein
MSSWGVASPPLGDRAWLTGRGSGGCRSRRRPSRPVWRGGRSQATQAPIMFFKDQKPAALRRDLALPVSGCHALDAVITARDTSRRTGHARQPIARTPNFAPDGQQSPAQTALRTAVGPSSLARRKPGVQIPSPPPPNQQVRASPASSRRRSPHAGAALGPRMPTGGSSTSAWERLSKLVDHQSNPSLDWVQRPALLATHRPCLGSSSSRPWERWLSAWRSSSRVMNPTSVEAVSLSRNALGPAARKRWVTQPPGKV